MPIETATAQQQLNLLRRARIASSTLQRFAEDARPLPVGQAAALNTACSALMFALNETGFGPAPLPDTTAIINSGEQVLVTNSLGEPGATCVAVVVGKVLDPVKLPATFALVKSGNSTAAVTGTGTKAALTVSGGKITGITLSA